MHTFSEFLLRRLLPACAALVISLPSFAQSAPPTSAVVTTPQVHAELLAYAPEGVDPGKKVWVGLQIEHQPEWHTYWKNPGDSGLPTTLEWKLPVGVMAGEIAWPMPHRLTVGPLVNYGYEGKVLLAVPLDVTPGFKPGTGLLGNGSELTVQLKASWLVCRRECIPEEGEFLLKIPTKGSTGLYAKAFEMAIRGQSLPHKGQALAQVGPQGLELGVEGLPASWHQKKLVVWPATPAVVNHQAAGEGRWEGERFVYRVPVSSQRETEPTELEWRLVSGHDSLTVVSPVKGQWPTVVSEDASASAALEAAMQRQQTGVADWLPAVLGALLGGALLNLMPCVFPVLAIKVLGFSRKDGRHTVEGLSYSLGVVLSFLALGALLLALRAAGQQLGWGFQLQSPAVVIALAVLFTLIGLNLMGLFEVGNLLPSAWLNAQSRNPVVNAGLSGVLAVAIASPCTAPFMGASLGVAVTLPTAQALAVFGAMGVGMALPYLLLCLAPHLGGWLPRPGAWMDVLRQALAFPMFATVVWLVWVLGQQVGMDGAAALLALLVVLTALLWALHQNGRARWALSALAALLLVAGGITLGPSLFNVEAVASDGGDPTRPDAVAGLWTPWSAQKVAESLARNEPVFVDFTAAWCITCQYNKKTVLSQPEVLGDFARHRVQLLRADWTRRDPAISAALQALGRSGVPVYVLYSPKSPPQVLSEVLSVDQVKAALNALPSPGI